jgi:hypothetical protein
MHVGDCHAEVVQLTPGLGELVMLGSLLVLLYVSHSPPSRCLHLALDGFDTQSIARQRVEQRR